MLSVLGLCSDDDRVINKYGTVDGMRIGKGTEILGEKLTPSHCVYHKSHMT
jgi:hypothetical protein